MPNCPICYGYPFEGEHCPICGFPVSHSLNPSPERLWRVFYRKPDSPIWHHWDFTRYELAKAMKRRFEKLGYETRPIMPLFEGHSSNPYEMELIEKPLSWDNVAAWLEAEGNFYTHATNSRLDVTIELTQGNRVAKGVTLLGKVRDFIAKETGAVGRIRPKRLEPTEIWSLVYRKHTHIYRIDAEILPYLHHPKRIDEVIHQMKTIEQFKQRTIKRITSILPQLKGWERSRALAHLRPAQRDLQEIEKIKKEHPYLYTILE